MLWTDFSLSKLFKFLWLEGFHYSFKCGKILIISFSLSYIINGNRHSGFLSFHLCKRTSAFNCFHAARRCSGSSIIPVVCKGRHPSSSSFNLINIMLSCGLRYLFSALHLPGSKGPFSWQFLRQYRAG